MNEKEIICQVETQKLGPFHENILEIIWLELKNFIRKVKTILVNTIKFLKNLSKKEIKHVIPLKKEIRTLNLQVGERVKVKSVEEIKKTLNDGKLQGCAFTKEMWPYCDKEVVVFKRVDMFLNETNNKIQKISDTVLIENAFCEGGRSFGEICDRACFLFWKEAWLERVNN